MVIPAASVFPDALGVSAAPDGKLVSDPARLIVGLMSGTSHDGVDAVLTGVAGSGTRTRAELVHHIHLKYPNALRKDIARAFEEGRARDICELNFRLGRVFGKAALRCMEGAGISPDVVDAVASHGQTVCHIPPKGKRPGSTLQIGEPAVIARMTGLPVVADFRTADMAAGGHGAPLVPFADHVLFKKRTGVRAVQNIGGMANVTVVTPALRGVYAFDTGPGNSLMDIAMQALYNKPFDRGGNTAKRGRPDKRLLNELMRHPFLKKTPPRSTGRETFGPALLSKALARKLAPENIIATLTLFTALTIKDAYERFILKKHPIDEVVVSGGGVKNSYLMSLLKDALSPIRLTPVSDFGIPTEAKEALSFAVLANETLSGRPSNIPAATGATRHVILGNITLP